MKHIKPVIQRDSKDCGVCAMEWIFMYYGGYVSLEKLREDTNTDMKGTTAYHIVNALKKWGFDAVGILEKNLKSSTLKFPLIAHVIMKNGLEHFVVIKCVKNNVVYLMDPGVGDKKMLIDDFANIFTGHLILMHPRVPIIKMAKGITISKLFLNIIKKEKFLVLKIVITSILWIILSIISSYYLKVGSNALSIDLNYLKYIVFAFGTLVLIKIFIYFIRDYYENHLSNLVDTYIYPDFIEHIFSLPLKNIKSRMTGEIVTRIGELANIKNLFSEIFVSGILDSLLMLASMVILYIINEKLFFILLIFLIFYIIYGFIISKIIYLKVLENVDYQTDFNSLITEQIDMLESIKNLNIKDNILQKIERHLARFLYNNFKFNSFVNLTNLGKSFFIECSLFVINSYGFWCIYQGLINLVDLFTFNFLLSYCIDPIQNIINLLPKFNYIKATFAKIAEFINIEEEKNEEAKLNLKGNIKFLDVSYSYNNYDYILKNVNLNINDKEHVLLNGPSGVGKSTICKLLYKEFDNIKGEITIDNKNIKDLNLNTIRKNILYVSQDEKLFTGTIKENILLGRNVQENKFLEICKLCAIEDIVNKKSMRYESLIEPHSKNLSGGEKQRIILARGLLKKSNIIILDEALSEVDYKLESKIIKNIREYFQDKTIIYISHKNQTKAFSKIIEIGVKNELLSN